MLWSFRSPKCWTRSLESLIDFEKWLPIMYSILHLNHSVLLFFLWFQLHMYETWTGDLDTNLRIYSILEFLCFYIFQFFYLLLPGIQCCLFCFLPCPVAVFNFGHCLWFQIANFILFQRALLSLYSHFFLNFFYLFLYLL